MISIAQSPFVFSHVPGSTCLIPGTSFQVVAFPTRIDIYDLHQKEKRRIKEIQLDIQGPVQTFMVKQDLQKGCVTVWSGKLCCHILPTLARISHQHSSRFGQTVFPDVEESSEGKVKLTLPRMAMKADGNTDGQSSRMVGEKCELEVVFRKKPGVSPPAMREQLSFGSHKKQEWEGIRKRVDFREIFPFWFRLGSLLELPETERDERGVFALLKECRLAIQSNRPETILPAFKKLFLAGFEGILVPRLRDEQFQGILPPETPIPHCSPLYLLKEGAELIRSLFIASLEREVAILPHLPPQFFAGRMLNLHCPPYGELDLEWSKKQVRRIVFRAHQEGELHFRFCSPLRRFRLRTTRRDKGKIMGCSEPLEIKSGCHYVLDQFQK